MSDPRSNRKSLFAGAALALGILLLVSVNLLGNSVLRNLRVDLTEDKLFTLSDGTKDMLSTLEEPLLLRFYMNQNLANEFPSIRDYGRRVRDVLAEYAAASSSKISLEILNPEPFSDTEDDAVSFGLQGVPVDAAGDRLYFGLVGTNTVDEKSVIQFFRQEREPFLEYDLTRLIYEISTVTKPVVGVVSSLSIYGGPGNPQVGEPAYKPAWAVITQLEQMFQVRQINLDMGPVEEDVDILMLVHPNNLTGIARYEIDQFVLRGGRALVFVDPLSEESAKTPDPDNPLAPKNSTLPDLFKAWGVELVPGMLVADARAAQRVQTSDQGRSVVLPYLPWLSLELPNFNPEEVATSQLGRVTMRSAGRLEPVADSEVAFVPLIQSSPESMMLERFYVQFGGNPTALLDRFEAQGIPYTLAARLHGIVDSAFPNGPMKDEDSTSGSDSTPEPLGELPDNHISQSTEPINVVVVSDTDMLVDSTWVQTQQFMGRALTIPMADNGAFVANVLELLGGGANLIGLRTRGTGLRPFKVVDELQREAEALFRETENGLQERLEETEKKLSEMRSGGGINLEILSEEEETTIAAFQNDLLNIRKQLRDVRHELRKDIEGLGTILKVINIGGIPILVGIIAIFVSLLRRRHRRRALAMLQ